MIFLDRNNFMANIITPKVLTLEKLPITINGNITDTDGNGRCAGGAYLIGCGTGVHNLF